MKIKTFPVTVNLPCIVAADDYHEFAFMQDAYRQLGIHGVLVEEIAFHDMRYVAVVHQNTPEHLASIVELRAIFSELEED